MQRTARMKREVQLLEQCPPHGVSCWMKEQKFDNLEAQIIGGEETPYEGGIFKMDIQIPERYPFEPPKMRFVTPIYHPNIDNAGRICLDSLKMPPKGAWKPALNVSTLLTTVQLLMAEPNPDDPLMTDIANEFKCNRGKFQENAKQWTRKYAMSDTQAVPMQQAAPANSSSAATASSKENQENLGDINRSKVMAKRSNPPLPLHDNVKKTKS